MTSTALIDVGVILLIILTGAVSLFVTYLVWRDGYKRGWRTARRKEPTCLKCGYNLSGLTQCRCPECGSVYQLDELWRSYIVTT